MDHAANHDEVHGGDNGKDDVGGGGQVDGSGESADSADSGPTGDENQTGDDGDENGLLVFGDCGLRHFLAFRRIGLFRCIEYISMFWDNATPF